MTTPIWEVSFVNDTIPKTISFVYLNYLLCEKENIIHKNFINKNPFNKNAEDYLFYEMFLDLYKSEEVMHFHFHPLILYFGAKHYDTLELYGLDQIFYSIRNNTHLISAVNNAIYIYPELAKIYTVYSIESENISVIKFVKGDAISSNIIKFEIFEITNTIDEITYLSEKVFTSTK